MWIERQSYVWIERTLVHYVWIERTLVHVYVWIERISVHRDWIERQPVHGCVDRKTASVPSWIERPLVYIAG